MFGHYRRSDNAPACVALDCPDCGAILIVPVNKAVDGAVLYCPVCKKEFAFSP